MFKNVATVGGMTRNDDRNGEGAKNKVGGLHLSNPFIIIKHFT